jgi:hypothetical protein
MRTAVAKRLAWRILTFLTKVDWECLNSRGQKNVKLHHPLPFHYNSNIGDYLNLIGRFEEY